MMNLTSGFYQVGDMEVFFSRPEHYQNSPVILVFQEAFGVNHHIQDVCQRLARENYFAVAPELFHRHGKNIVFDYSDRDQAMNLLKSLTADQLTQDIRNLLKYLATIPGLNLGRIGSIGFCLGGYTSILAACRFNLKTAISFYGAGLMHERPDIALVPLKDEFKLIGCPILMFFGENDSSIPVAEVHAIEKELEDEQKVFSSIIMPDSKHGFFCDERPAYNKEAANAAWKMSLKWMRVYLHSTTSGDSEEVADSSPPTTASRAASGEASV